MTSNIYKTSARLVSGIFNPFLIPTIGILIIMNHIPGLEFYTTKAKFVLLMIVFLSTCFLPLLFITILSRTPGQSKEMDHHKDRIIPYLFTAFSIFLGAQLLTKLPFPSLFRLFLVGSCFILVLLFIITIWWKISGHTAAVGGLLGTLLALTFKYGLDLLWPIIAVILISGAVGTSRIYLQKHTPSQVYTGFAMSVLVMYVMVYFF